MRCRFFLLALAMLWSVGLLAQESKLAEQYFQNGEFEKASQVYLKLYGEQPAVGQFFERYIDCLIAIQRYDEGESALRREIRKNPKTVQYYVLLGDILTRQERVEDAEKEYANALKELPADRLQIIKLANAFLQGQNYEAASETYRKGAILLKDPYVFSYNLGDLYRQSGDFPKMIEQYLITLRADSRRQSTIQMLIQRFLPEEDFPELQAQLYEQIQEHPEEDMALIELLTWTFIQQKDYLNALRQTKALDQKLNENGVRIYNLGQVAISEKDYRAAIDAFKYIIEVRGPESPFYYEAKRSSLYAQRQLLLFSGNHSKDSLQMLEGEYVHFIDESGRNHLVAPIMIELAELQALYLYEIDKAIQVLEEVIALPGLVRDIQSDAKLKLGDYYFIRGDVWDATLLYSQVDKIYKDDPLGHEARFRNARLSYFNEDFEWAQAQFKVLKSSTSKLIANDALDISVFIMDNLGLDTTHEAMGLYAQAEMMVFQNRHQDALQMLDSLTSRFPVHSLVDDVLYLKAQIHIKDRAFPKAATLLHRIVEEFPEDIRADNALYMLGDLYAGPLKDQQKAMDLYEKLFTDYSNSTFAVEARKQFRLLRGDRIQ